MAQVEISSAAMATNPAKRVKLTGRAFYESIGSPKMIVAPMVDRSEFAWRLLTRSYLDEKRSKQLLAYTPMFHARLFQEQARFRDAHFQPTKDSLTSKEKSSAAPFLDGRTDIDRPLFVQFCANKPNDFLEAAQYVAPYCDAVDLNLGCPQGIARSGHYGAFLQEDWDTIGALISKLRDELDVPVTAKFRIQESKEKTLEYANMILDAGASIITVHGRQRHQKGHHTGIADWDMIRYLRDNLPPETVLFANGNILNGTDIEPCLAATGADGVMSAEGNLSDPTIFASPPEDQKSREYWLDPSNAGLGGYRIDGVFRRYMDIIYRYVLEQEPPSRRPLYIPGESEAIEANDHTAHESATSTAVNGHTTITGSKRTNETVECNGDAESDDKHKPSKKQKNAHNKRKDTTAVHNPNLKSMQGHLFQLLRPMLSNHTNIRDALSKCRAGNIQAFEDVLSMVENAIKKGLDEEHSSPKQSDESENTKTTTGERKPDAVTDIKSEVKLDEHSSETARLRCKRPFWVCQPHVRPLPEEAVQTGAITVSKKEKEALANQGLEAQNTTHETQQNTSKNTIGQKRNGLAGETFADAANRGSAQANGETAFSKSQAAVAQRIEMSSEQGEDPSISMQDVEGSELPKEEALTCG